jgi:hypothetical protein
VSSRILAAGLCLALAGVAGAGPAAEPGAIAGVWRGKVGTAPVMACLEANSGEYYYEKFRSSIPLNAAKPQDGSWIEGDEDGATGRWSHFTIHATQLQATWASVDGGKQLPIQLTRVAPLQHDESCDSGAVAAYEKPRRAATSRVEGPVVASKIQNLLTESSPVEAGPKIRVLSAELKDDTIRILQLEATDPGATKINSTLREWFDSAVSSYYGCRNFGEQGSFDLEADELAFASERWLGVRRIDRSMCGGPYPSAEISVESFDRQTGELVDPAGWVEIGDDPAAGLLKRVLDREFQDAGSAEEREHQAECREAWEAAGLFTVWPTRAGLAFSPSLPHVDQKCGDDVELSYADIAPFLTAQGREALHGRR